LATLFSPYLYLPGKEQNGETPLLIIVNENFKILNPFADNYKVQWNRQNAILFRETIPFIP
jgi:hypothetical protein